MPNCVQCDNSKRVLDRSLIKYDVVDLSTNQDAYEKVTALGYKAAPVIIAGNEHWSGFRLDKLKNLIAVHNGKEAHHV